MMIKRIVSFLPSATELIYELEMQHQLYGVTHECKFPQEATTKPQVIDSVIKSDKLSSKEIDKITCQLLNDGKDIFVLNEENLKQADPDLIISQETCEVCAAYTSQVNNAVKILKRKPMLYSMNPHNVQEIIESVTELGKILLKESKAKEITDVLKERINNIKKLETKKKPKILAIEWLEPFFTAGHWVPEMIEVAGGINMVSKTGEHSKRMNFDEIKQADPDIILLMPCGFDTKRTIIEHDKILKNDKNWNSLRAVRNKQVFALDANSFFSKPSIRTIEGMEILAKIIQPENTQEITVSEKSYSKIL